MRMHWCMTSAKHVKLVAGVLRSRDFLAWTALASETVRSNIFIKVFIIYYISNQSCVRPPWRSWLSRRSHNYMTQLQSGIS